MDLLCFYPENDIALGNGLTRFTPPRQAALLHRYGAPIMAWIAQRDSLIVAEELPLEWLQQVSQMIGHNIETYTPQRAAKITRVKPWGWSPALWQYLNDRGVAREFMPDADRLATMRKLSHRQTSIMINQRLAALGIDTPPLPIEVTDTVVIAKKLLDGDIMVKQPWSSSGRGLLSSREMSSSHLLELSAGMIRRQGSVIVEPLLDKLIDFAMLFEVSQGKVKFAGLSLFHNNNLGAYAGNIVAPQSLIANQIETAASTSLAPIAEALKKVLSEIIAKAYDGVCGIDMMVYRRPDNTFAIAPCVELNLRYTMGYIALCLSRLPITQSKPYLMTVGRCLPSSGLSAGSATSAEVIHLVPENPYFSFCLTPKCD